MQLVATKHGFNLLLPHEELLYAKIAAAALVYAHLDQVAASLVEVSNMSLHEISGKFASLCHFPS